MADELDRLRRLRQLEAEQQSVDDSYYLRDPKTGLSQAQLDAQKALQEAQDARVAAGLQGKIVTKPGSAGQLSTPPTEGLKTGYEWYAFNIPGGGFEWRQKPTKETLAGAYGKLFSGPTGPTSFNSGFTDNNSSSSSAATLAAQQAAAAAAEDKRRQGQSAYNLLFSEFERYGLGSLVKPLQEFIVEGLSPAEFTLRLRETDAYKKRFAANAQRINKGLRALSEAEYITLEDQYQNVMRNYGLPASYYARGDMGVQQGFEKFIAGDVSAAELEDRIQTAQNRVINAAPQVSDALKKFYPEITNGDILAYVLDPENSLGTIKRKVTISEIGGAAFQKELGLDVTRASELARYGVTGETAKQGFGVIAGGLERGRQLSKLQQGPEYTQAVAESEVFALPEAEKARRMRQEITKKEAALFTGGPGITGGALARDRAGAI